jgi:molybdopterin-guanine dinucleotide biosynthesis protein A
MIATGMDARRSPGRARLGAIVLAGGRASRVDGEVKPLFEIGGRTLLAAAVTASADAGAVPIIVVAPVLDPGLPVRWVREHPPFGGPAAGVVAALTTLAVDTSPEWTLLLACDLPEVEAAVCHLNAGLPLLPPDADGLCLADSSGRPQWLTGLYRTRALRDAASALPDAGRDQPMRALLGALELVTVSAPDDLLRDIDTWDDWHEARARSGHEPAHPTEEPT